MSEHVRNELLLRVQRLLDLEPDPCGVPDSRFNKRVTIKSGGNKIMIRSKRRGDLDITLWTPEYMPRVGMFVYKNKVSHAPMFIVGIVESHVLPMLRGHMVLDDLADV